jgi:hypothetical protein
MAHVVETVYEALCPNPSTRKKVCRDHFEFHILMKLLENLVCVCVCVGGGDKGE